MVKRQQNIDLFLRDRKSYFDCSQRFDDHQDISSQLDDLFFYILIILQEFHC